MSNYGGSGSVNIWFRSGGFKTLFGRREGDLDFDLLDRVRKVIVSLERRELEGRVIFVVSSKSVGQ